MSLYGNLTLREWLTIHCTTEDVDGLFRKALKNNDEPMTVLAMSELIKRGDIDLVTYAIKDAIDAGSITLGSHFSTVFANALTNLGSRDPILRCMAKNMRKNGSMAAIKTPDDDMLPGWGHEPNNNLYQIDERLDEFLKSFQGWKAIRVWLYEPGTEWDPHTHETVSTNYNNYFGNVIIKDGQILNHEEIPSVINVLDAGGIVDPLPKFDGKELGLYTLDNGDWVEAKQKAQEGLFYMTYYSLE